MTDAKANVLAVRGVEKWYGATHALRGLSLAVRPGETLGLVGENGAGKSTLMRVVAGAEAPDAGEIEFLGRRVVWRNPSEARRAGIAIVYQEPQVYPKLSVLENLFSGNMRTRLGPFLDHQGMRAEAEALLEQFGLPRALAEQPMGELSLGTQQMILIARAFHTHARLLILDEPTAILSSEETGRLFRAIATFKAADPEAAVIYISHRLQELQGLVQRIVVLKDGAVAGELAAEAVSEEAVVELMTGRSAERRPRDEGRRVAAAGGGLRVEGLTAEPFFRDVSFFAERGRVLGLYGLVGSGRSEVALAVFGALRPTRGRVLLDGQEIRARSPAEAMRAGIAYVPEDRKRQALFPALSVLYNTVCANEPRLSRHGFLDRERERQEAEAVRRRFRVRVGDLEDRITTLSGGNQQKVVLGRWLTTGPRVLILDEPTHGVDVEVKAQIHDAIRSLSAEGLVIVMISSDLAEVLALSDSVLVMREGRVLAQLAGEEIREERILRLALGYGEEPGTEEATP